MARDRSPSSRCANASATASSVRMMVMSATWAARRTPAATRRASSGRPASASPKARVPSNARRRSGSRLSATSACRTSSDASSQRSDNASSRATPLAANRPSGSCQQDVAEVEHHLSTQRSALDPASADDRRRGPQHVHPRPDGVARARLVDPPRQLLDELHEPTPIDQQVAPGVVDHRLEIAHGDGGGYRRDRPPDRGLTAAVVEAAVVRGEESQHVSRSIGEEPLIERDDHLVGVLEPARGTGVQLGQAARVTDSPGRRSARPGPARAARTSRRHRGGSRTARAPRPCGGAHRRRARSVSAWARLGLIRGTTAAARQDVDHLGCLVRQHLVQHVVLDEHVVVGAGPGRDRLRPARPGRQAPPAAGSRPSHRRVARPPRCVPPTAQGTAGSSARPPRPVRTATRRSGSRRAGRATSCDRSAASARAATSGRRGATPAGSARSATPTRRTKSSTSTRWKSSMTSTADGRSLGLQIGDQLVDRVGPAAGTSQHRQSAGRRIPAPTCPGPRSRPTRTGHRHDRCRPATTTPVGVDDSAIQPATSDVFPVPAGATTSVSRLPHDLVEEVEQAGATDVVLRRSPGRRSFARCNGVSDGHVGTSSTGRLPLQPAPSR